MAPTTKPTVGVINGLVVVYDPEIQMRNSRWVLLFAAAHSRLIAYQKSHARSVMTPPRESESRSDALRKYEAWRNAASQELVERARSEVARKDESLAKILVRATEKHRRQLEGMGIRYCGVTEPDGRGPVRDATCRGCHRAIGSDSHLLCTGCRWIVCLNCGTCGCDWGGN